MKTFIKLILSRAKTRSVALGVGITLLLFSFSNTSFGQIYANQASSRAGAYDCGTVGCAFSGVDDPGEARNGSAADTDFATLFSNNVLGVSRGRAYITLLFPGNLPAQKTVYVKIDQPTATGIVSSLLGFVGLIENGNISGQLRSGANNNSDGSAVTTASTQIITDASGNNFYLAITPGASNSTSFNAVRINVSADFDLVSSVSLNVYNAFYYDGGVETNCNLPKFVSLGSQTGLTVNLFDLVIDPEESIDGVRNSSNFSVLQNGVVAVASAVSETVYLGQSVPGTNEIVATISRPDDLLDLSVLENITIQAFEGDNAVGSAKTIADALLDLQLQLPVGPGNLVTIKFVPGGTSYDRIVIRSVTLANATLFTGINIHEIGSLPPLAFAGGKLASGRVNDVLSRPITTAGATAPTDPVSLPGFNLVSCGSETFTLFNVTQNGRVLAGSLPPSLELTSSGVLQGTPIIGQDGTYSFDVQVTNSFGQTAVAKFLIAIAGPLPVKLISFTAKPEGQSTSLTWSTSEETNSDRFNIERSQNGKTWSEIGSILSNHESLTLQHYSFTDSSPLNGENLYRLKMIDLDKTFAYSSIENVTFNLDASLKVYPNPVLNSENLQLSAGDWSKVKSIKIINSFGKTVFQSEGKWKEPIQTNHLTSGLYIVQFIQNDGTVKTDKFIKL